MSLWWNRKSNAVIRLQCTEYKRTKRVNYGEPVTQSLDESAEEVGVVAAALAFHLRLGSEALTAKTRAALRSGSSCASVKGL